MEPTAAEQLWFDFNGSQSPAVIYFASKHKVSDLNVELKLKDIDYVLKVSDLVKFALDI